MANTDTKTEVEKSVVKETAEEFSNRVEELVWLEDIQYFDAVTKLTILADYEAAHVAKLITPVLKAKLAEEMEKLHQLKPTKKK